MQNQINDLLLQIQQCAESLGVEVYLVGGFVRDTLLGKLNDDTDIDLLIAEDSKEFANCLQGILGGELKEFPKFLTKKIVAIKEAVVSEIDIIQTRKESYPTPGSLPVVAAGSLNDDLARRDFSINALACRQDKYNLLDSSKPLAEMKELVLCPEGALEDLESKLIRVLHDKSFLEDPTRLFRAVRYKVRLGAEWEPKTYALYKEAVSGDFLNYISTQRVANEILKILTENLAAQMWQELHRSALLTIDFISPEAYLAIGQALEVYKTYAHDMSREDALQGRLLLLALIADEVDSEQWWRYFSFKKPYKKQLSRILNTVLDYRFDELPPFALAAALAAPRLAAYSSDVQKYLTMSNTQ